MAKILTKLRIDEISSVNRGAGEGCRIVLYKRDGGKPMVGKPNNWDEPRGYLTFNEAMGDKIAKHRMMRKLSEVAADEADVRNEDDDKKEESKLRAWARLMVVVDPSRSEEEHLFRLTSTAH